MSIKYATLLVKAGEVMPKEVATVITKEYSTGFGYAIAYEGVLEVEKDLGEVDPDQLMTLQEANKEATKLFWFCKSDNTLLAEDLQPFVLVDDQIVACFTGDFSEYAQTGSSHTNEHHATEKIKPKALKLWKSNNESMDDYVKALKDPENDDTHDTMFGWIPSNGAMAALLASGDCFGESKAEGWEQEFSWGWAYGAPASKPEEKEEPVKVKFSLKKSSTETKTEPETKKPEPNFLPQKWQDVQGKTLKYKHDGKEQSFPAVLALAQDGVTTIPVSGPDPVIPLPSDRDTKDKIQAWYKEKLGYCPHNWKNRPYIKLATNVVKLGDLQNTTAAAALQTAASGKDTGNKFIPPPKLVSKEIVKHFLEVDWPKILGQNSEFIQNPKFIEDEAKEPSLAALMNDKRFIDVSSFDMPRMARCYLLSHIGGPASEYWVAFADNWIKDNIQARKNLLKQIADQSSAIKNLTEELDTFRSKLPETKASEGAATPPTRKFSLKK